MNASGRPNTCKSRGSRKKLAFLLTTGARVRNTYAIYPYLEDSPEKSGLIFHSTAKTHVFAVKAPADKDEHASH